MNQVTRRRRGRPQKIDRDDIIHAVLAEGFAGITVPAVADRLGVTAATLYRHVHDRGQMLAMTWGHLVDSTRWPSAQQPWDGFLRDSTETLWRLFEQHDGSASALSPGPMPPQMVNLVDDLAVVLVNAGFAPRDAVLAVDLTVDLAVDHRLGVERLARLTSGSATVRQELSSAWSPSQEDLGARGQVRRVMVEAISSPPFDWFTRKLDLALSGIAQELAPRRSPTSTPPDGG